MASIDLETGVFLFGDGMPFGHEVARAAQVNPAIRPRHVLRATRTALRELLSSKDEGDQTIVTDINTDLSEELVVADIGSTGLAQWNARPLHALGRATYDQLLKFCMWNVDCHTDRIAEMAAVTPKLADNAIRQAERRIDGGFWPEVARHAIEKAVDAAGNLQPMDSFETGGMNADGYCVAAENRLALTNRFLCRGNLAKPSAQMRITALHEYLHFAGSKLNGGFMGGVTDSLGQHSSGRLLEEAYVGYSSEDSYGITAEKDGNDQHWITPLCIGSYKEEREFIGAVTSQGSSPVPDDLVGEAYFSSLSEPNRARRELQKRLNRSLTDIFPEHQGHALEALCEQYEKASSAGRKILMDGWIERTYDSLGYETLTDTLPDDGTTPIYRLEPVA